MMQNLDTDYWHLLRRRTNDLGGLFNAHLHLDRAGTFSATVDGLPSETGVSALSLRKKHSLIPWIHGECYGEHQIAARVEPYLQRMVACGTRRADTVVDVTDDGVEFRALDVFLELKDKYAGQLDLRVGAYSPLGFKMGEARSWELIEQAAQRSDFVGLLPERDDQKDYPEQIGFEECCRRGLLLARRLGQDIHIHVDQVNQQDERASERVVALVRELDLVSEEETPWIWLIHSISPSTYPEARFQALADSMAELKIGLICCPAAAISMRQLRPLHSPTYNCIARVLDFLASGVSVRLGSDNVCDITSPMGTVDLMDELLVLGNALRFYDLEILARLGAGLPLTQTQRIQVRQHLQEDQRAVAAEIARMKRHADRV